jgi:hypothetical protein
MTAIIALVSPIIVSLITSAAKRLPTFTSLTDNRKLGVRVLSAGVTLFVVVFQMWQSGAYNENLISDSLITFIGTVWVWTSSTGIYHTLFDRK